MSDDEVNMQKEEQERKPADNTLRCRKCGKTAILKYELCADCRRDILRSENYEPRKK